jgi:hypothetical protein
MSTVPARAHGAFQGLPVLLDIVDDLDASGLLELQRPFHLLADIEGLLQSEQQDAIPAGLELDLLPGFDLEFSIGRVLLTPSTVVISCTSMRLAAGDEPPINRSAVLPLLVMVR